MVINTYLSSILITVCMDQINCFRKLETATQANNISNNQGPTIFILCQTQKTYPR